MGWTCQHDFQGFCKRVQQPCVPGMKGCTLKTEGVVFSSGSYETDKQNQENKEKNNEIDFAALARSH